MTSEQAKNQLMQVRQRALELGFKGFGVAPATVLDTTANRFDRWIESGYAGEMAYMARGAEKRKDPTLILPGVKSVVCLSYDYLTTHKSMEFAQDKATGDISLYALNLDYHDALAPRLEAVEAALQEAFPGCKTRRYIDTGPVLEKAMAEQAGIGWIGKHTNVITEGEGSWYFLAEILTDVELPRSDPATDHCGTCRSCIDVCPTNAIIAPYVLDSRKCISYLTIELKGPIPIEFRAALGNHIYGCDDCQIVCPWNSHAVTTDENAFIEREGTRALVELMRLDDEGFRERFRKSPVKRIKRRGLLRNVAVALGNSGDRAAVPVLLEALADVEPLIRAHALWAVGRLLGEEAREAIGSRLDEETDEMVLEERRRIVQA
ncbi:MAG: tRNA epoxyqueuosine(34) reductase QueG [Candidatus Nitrohelix vancouverensis]|uniref:tRNA epoxyqueuosine(34) reductase QueG n=1 Tax=Candidatus Nitrohelix vancouverensis TaxID=2705534 RepID=A0A7T0G296_9BACT|nr:MAG: tRNA epoxyqueuosine(34) reductase QueG [Candidatus Nitrohelix vancouverensis]